MLAPLHRRKLFCSILTAALAGGCVGRQAVELDTMIRAKPGDRVQDVTALSQATPRTLFIVENADGSIDRCLLVRIKLLPKKYNIEFAYLFRNDRLLKVVYIDRVEAYEPPAYNGWVVPMNHFDDETALIEQIRSSQALTPELQRQVIAERAEIPRNFWLTFAPLLLPIVLPIILPQAGINKLTYLCWHDHFDPTRLGIGSSVVDADRTFGPPLRVSSDDCGREMRMYFMQPKISDPPAPPIVATFVHDRAVRIVTGYLAQDPRPPGPP